MPRASILRPCPYRPEDISRWHHQGMDFVPGSRRYVGMAGMRRQGFFRRRLSGAGQDLPGQGARPPRPIPARRDACPSRPNRPRLSTKPLPQPAAAYEQLQRAFSKRRYFWNCVQTGLYRYVDRYWTWVIQLERRRSFRVGSPSKRFYK